MPGDPGAGLAWNHMNQALLLPGTSGWLPGQSGEGR